MAFKTIMLGFLTWLVVPATRAADCFDITYLNSSQRAFCLAITERNCDNILFENGNDSTDPDYLECKALLNKDCAEWLPADSPRMQFCKAITEKDCRLTFTLDENHIIPSMEFNYCMGILEEDCTKYLSADPFYKSLCGLFYPILNNPEIESVTARVTPDEDNDGWPDVVDNCKRDPNAYQLDVDGDGVGDACDDDIDGDGFQNEADDCPMVSNDQGVDSDGNGIGDACQDSDDDSILDKDDKCPNVLDYAQLDLDRDGKGDLCDSDSDGDNVDDILDNCIYDKNTDQADADADGIGDICKDDKPEINDILTAPFFKGTTKYFPLHSVVDFFPTIKCGDYNKLCQRPLTYKYKWTFSKIPTPPTTKPNEKVFEYENIEDVVQDELVTGQDAPPTVVGRGYNLRYTFNWPGSYKVKLVITLDQIGSTWSKSKELTFEIEKTGGGLCGSLHPQSSSGSLLLFLIGLCVLSGLRKSNRH